MAKKYGKRSIRSSEREADFRKRENPFPEIWHRNGKCNLSRRCMADKVHFRYRGYYYDEETGFYYLQSRYYAPSICRFISADQYELLPELSDSLGKLNLYAYCANNPIMYTDPGGTMLLPTAVVIIGAVTGAIIGGYIGYQSVVNDPTLTTSQKLAGIGQCAILGGIAGGILGAGLGYALPAMISGGIGSAEAAALVGAVAISVEEAVAIEYLLNNKFGLGNWHKGAKTDFNALKKWFDRIIRNWRR